MANKKNAVMANIPVDPYSACHEVTPISLIRVGDIFWHNNSYYQAIEWDNELICFRQGFNDLKSFDCLNQSVLKVVKKSKIFIS